MINKILTLILLFACSLVYGQQSVDTTVDNKADAVNSGVYSGSTYAPVSNSTNYTKVLPGAIQAPPLPSSNGCVLTSFTGGAVGWNAISGTTGGQTLAEHCVLQDNIKMAIALCQYKTAMLMFNNFIKKKYDIDVEIDPSIKNECKQQKLEPQQSPQQPQPSQYVERKEIPPITQTMQLQPIIIKLETYTHTRKPSTQIQPKKDKKKAC